VVAKAGLLTVPALCLWSNGAACQAVVTVPDVVACSTCSIVLRSTTALGSLEDTDKFPAGLPDRVSRDAHGRYWRFSNTAPPALFDASGRFLRMLGRKGQGPGEYIAPQNALFVGDSVVVLDVRQRRASVLNSELQYVRAMVMPAQMYQTVVLSWPDSIIMGARVPSAASVGWPLHLVSFGRRGDDNKAYVVTSFGPGDGSARPSDGMVRSWYVTPSKDGFWAAPPTSYRVLKWKRKGLEMVQTLRRDPSWFRGESSGTLGGPERTGAPWRPPGPIVVGIEEDSEGLLWAYLNVPGPSWKEAWTLVKRDLDAGKQPRMSDLGWEKLYQTRIEVIDPAAGRVLARTVLDGFLAINAPGGHRLAVYATDDARGETVSVLEFELIRPGR
jgi:hypothetical protein